MLPPSAKIASASRPSRRTCGQWQRQLAFIFGYKASVAGHRGHLVLRMADPLFELSFRRKLPRQSQITDGEATVRRSGTEWNQDDLRLLAVASWINRAQQTSALSLEGVAEAGTEEETRGRADRDRRRSSDRRKNVRSPEWSVKVCHLG